MRRGRDVREGGGPYFLFNRCFSCYVARLTVELRKKGIVEGGLVKRGVKKTTRERRGVLFKK